MYLDAFMFYETEPRSASSLLETHAILQMGKEEVSWISSVKCWPVAMVTANPVHSVRRTLRSQKESVEPLVIIEYIPLRRDQYN